MGDAALLCVAHDGPVVTLTLNRPDALNAINRALSTALIDTFRALSDDTTLRAIILTGAGRAFSAGVDLKEVAQAGEVATAFDWAGGDSLFDVVKACPHPVISAVNGFAITGGLELALLGDFLIASDAAMFADTHARVGITPSWGLTQILPRLIGPNRARQMSLTGEFIGAQTACDWGLVNEVVSAADLMPRARAIAGQIAETDPLAARRIRDLIHTGASLPLDQALMQERDVFATHIAQVKGDALDQNRKAVTERGRAQATQKGD